MKKFTKIGTYFANYIKNPNNIIEISIWRRI